MRVQQYKTMLIHMFHTEEPLLQYQ